MAPEVGLGEHNPPGCAWDPWRAQCTLMKMLTAQKFNCLVTNDANCTYFGCPGWKALADAYEMEAGERATFYLDYDRDKIMVYYKPAGSDDGAVTPDYDLTPPAEKS
ncbi:hypothetical protein VPH35_096917 [Triticum aestivum]|uniref:Uncharacterized protein n=1 Tax=Aegilops tauschii TaxID=37682 RepID=M8BVY5_AEGTA